MPVADATPSPPVPDLRSRIESLMKRLNITRRDELARRIGYSRTALYTFENAIETPSDRFLLALEALENRAEGAANIVKNEERNEDPVARLLINLDFAGVLSVMEAGVGQLRAAGRMVPDACRQVQMALEEIHRRSPTGAANLIKPPHKKA